MDGQPLTRPATSSHIRFLREYLSLSFPDQPQINNDGDYIVSLSQFTCWLAQFVEDEFGVEIYPGFVGPQLLLSPSPNTHDPWGNPAPSVQGVITNEVGLSPNFTPKLSFEPGMAFRAKVTLLGKGAHGSLFICTDYDKMHNLKLTGLALRKFDALTQVNTNPAK